MKDIIRCKHCGRMLSTFEILIFKDHCEECVQNFNWD